MDENFLAGSGEIHHNEIHADELCTSNPGSFGQVHGNEWISVDLPVYYPAEAEFAKSVS
jgi:hypothetical protein